MFTKIIGVTLDGTPGPNIVWRKTDVGYTASSEDEARPIVIHADALPPIAERDNHSLFTLVTTDGALPAWINTYRLSLPWRRSTVDALRLAGYRWYAHLIVPFVDMPPTLVLFGRGQNAFSTDETDETHDHQAYDTSVRKTLRSDLRLTVTQDNGSAQIEAQLLEPGGLQSKRTGVTVYWESSGGYFLSARTQSVDGKATAVLKDYTTPCLVKAGFRYFPAKAEITL